MSGKSKPFWIKHAKKLKSYQIFRIIKRRISCVVFRAANQIKRCPMTFSIVSWIWRPTGAILGSWHVRSLYSAENGISLSWPSNFKDTKFKVIEHIYLGQFASHFTKFIFYSSMYLVMFQPNTALRSLIFTSFFSFKNETR